MPDSKLASIIQSKNSEILEAWVREQKASIRMDLITEEELRSLSLRFLRSLSEAVKQGNVVDIARPEFAPIRDILSELSRNWSRRGFTPSQTARFVFSLKQPLFTELREAHGAGGTGLMDDLWPTTLLIDNLGLFTSETFQQAREEVIRRQQEEMLELSTPVVQLWDGVVALPLIGTLDSSRTSVVMESLLQTIVQTRSEIAIIDITGVPTVDTQVAQHLLKTVAAARLMGADCIISGIRPQIAQTMVHLQIDLSTVTTKATMAEALRTALSRSGFVIGRSTKAKA